jgi:hypothetical protein
MLSPFSPAFEATEKMDPLCLFSFFTHFFHPAVGNNMDLVAKRKLPNLPLTNNW